MEKLKYWPYVLIGIIIIGIGYYIYTLKKEILEKNNRIYVQDSLIKLGDNEYKKLTEEYRLQEQIKNDLKKRNDSLYSVVNLKQEDIVYLNSIILKLKNQKYTKIDTVTKFIIKDSIIYVPLGDDIVTIKEENSLFKIDAQTFLYPQKGYILNLEGKPFTIDLVLTESKDGAYTTYIGTQNSDLELINFNAKVYKNDNSDKNYKFETLIGATYTINNISVNLDLLYNRIGLRGALGVDTKSYTLAEDKLFWGLGIVYRIF